jgi:Flp pilus assembly protein TadG
MQTTRELFACFEMQILMKSGCVCITMSLATNLKRLPFLRREGPMQKINSSSTPSKSLKLRSAKQGRGGAAVLELLLVMPILIIAIMAIVEFGLLYSNQQNVEMASRAGVQIASRLTTLSIVNNDPVPASVVTAVADELEKIGVTDYRIILEHNIDFTTNPSGTITPVELVSATAGAPANCLPTSTIAMSPNRRYVRVTVCINTTDLTPNLLQTFGFDLDERISQQSTTRRYAR